jgi:hypothetical protein
MPNGVYHFVRYDAERTRREARALCGRWVNELREHAEEPTCETCRRRLTELEHDLATMERTEGQQHA